MKPILCLWTSLVCAALAFAVEDPLHCFLLGPKLKRNPGSVQAKLSAKKTYYFEGKGSRITLVEGTDREGKRVADLNCVRTYNGKNGSRLECGGFPSVLEVLFKPGETRGAGVLYYREGGKLGKKYFNLEIDADSSSVSHVSGSEVKMEDVRDENKLVSPIAPTLPGFTLANAHGVGEKGPERFGTIRAMAPKSDEEFNALKNYGVDEVLIFKDGPRKVIEDERKKWKKLGLDEDKIHDIAFPWKEFKNYKDPCLKTVSALNLLMNAQSRGGTMFFHCTVGEDRTGFLAALFRMINQGGDPHDLFKEEMCERGYENGDPLKPYGPVVLKIRESLTETYVKMAHQIQTGKINKGNIKASVCNSPPSTSTLKKAGPSYDLSRYHCHTSSGFRIPGK